jgi:hypothetical protein
VGRHEIARLMPASASGTSRVSRRTLQTGGPIANASLTSEPAGGPIATAHFYAGVGTSSGGSDAYWRMWSN